MQRNGEKCGEMQRIGEKCNRMWSKEAPDSLSHYSKCQYSAECLVAPLCGDNTLQQSPLQRHYSAEYLIHCVCEEAFLCGVNTLLSHYSAEYTLDITPSVCGGTSLQSTLVPHSTLLQIRHTP